eukprot:TRINITY_DN13109_c3_g1_i1.p1 TRINITY_DN13109_c3_g1~~TRINITY_DN13109_c3_g1_i1.p1  ORF type:complete len:421 (-),score=46.00 TRINITY_DN13109_c3_g1_i1:221-1483(-)
MTLRWLKCDQDFAVNIGIDGSEIRRCRSEGWAPHAYSAGLPNSDSTVSLQVSWAGQDQPFGRRFSVGIVPMEYGLHLQKHEAEAERSRMIGGSQNESIGVRWLLRSNVVAGCCTSRGDITDACDNVQHNVFDPIKSGDRIDIVWRPQMGSVSFALNGKRQGCAVPVATRCFKFTIGAVLSPNLQLQFVESMFNFGAGDAKSHAVSCMQKIRMDQAFADATVKCGDRTWDVHRVVLAAASPVFRRMFESDFKEGKTSTVVITKDVDPDVIEAILEFVYTGQLASLDLHAEVGEPTPGTGSATNSKGKGRGLPRAPEDTGFAISTKGKGKHRKGGAKSIHMQQAGKMKELLAAIMEQAHVYAIDDLSELCMRKLMDNAMVDSSNIVRVVRILRTSKCPAVVDALEDFIKADSQLFQALMANV